MSNTEAALRTGLVANHWGLGRAEIVNGKIGRVVGHLSDPNPSKINDNIAGSLSGRARVLQPAIRRGWLEHGPGRTSEKRGNDVFVEMSWTDALDLLADELNRIRRTYGNDSLFAGSYGWGSAGRFHHPQSQLKRFLNTIGGFVRSEGNYSYNAALVLMPHIVGNFREHVKEATRFRNIAAHGKLVVMFGGIASRNGQVSDGGIGRHKLPDALKHCARRGVRFINISPLRRDAAPELKAEWLAIKPGTDVALMLGIAHFLLCQNLHDADFLARYTTGFERFAAYLTGAADGTAKDALWAGAITGIPASRIEKLAREMAENRTMITCAVALQRADFGEQPLWMTVTLAAMLGQIGLPGGGYVIGYGANGLIGLANRPFRPGTLPQGENPVRTFIPVAMISDMLLKPGRHYDYNGTGHRFPDIRMVWWAGGNPFHHHQDLNRLRAAFRRPETVIVNELNWTATARHADIILPVAAPEERRDFVCGQQDHILIPAPALTAPAGAARTEYDIFCDLSRRLGVQAGFTEGRSEEDWLRHLWQVTRRKAHEYGTELPEWEAFMRGDIIELPDPEPDRVFLSGFRADPDKNPLPTPSGRIEIASDNITGFGYDDCPGHAVWIPPRGMTGGQNIPFPLALISGQPATRLHSQYDNGSYSMAHKIRGREPVLIHPRDAAARAVLDGDIVEIFNAQGRCLAGARVTGDIAGGTVFLRVGAWYDPDDRHPQARDRHGNPNVLTHDMRTSRLSQGPAAHSAFVQIRRFTEPVPDIRAYAPPPTERGPECA